LLEDPEKSYHAKHRVTENDIFDNRLIFGDNVLERKALEQLEQEFAGKVKCIYIDLSYNSGSAQPIAAISGQRKLASARWSAAVYYV
jgi:adenine-specific DNA-methyltransferase